MTSIKNFIMHIPAIEEFTSVASIALSGACAAYGVPLDLLDDVRIASTEAIYCLRHQPGEAEIIEITCEQRQCGLIIEFTALSSFIQESLPKSDDNITRGILETLVPKVNILSDDRGIFCITFYFPNPKEDCQ